MTKGKILITPRAFAKSGKKEIERLENEGWFISINDTGKPLSHSDFVNRAKDADGIVVGVDKMDSEMLKSCQKLKAIAKYGVGVDNIDMSTAESLNIKISRTIGSNSDSVAEHTMALIFACAKNIVESAAEVKEGKWDKKYGKELANNNIGIIGFGNIGKKVARLAQGIGMTVYAYDVFPISSSYAKENNIRIVSFNELIKKSDIITVHLPLNKETKNLINAENLSLMKEDAILINAARGGIVNEQDLLKKLESSDSFTAGFDVYSEEPPKIDDRLVQHPRFILTPHVASKTQQADLNTMKSAVNNIMKDLEEVD